MMNIRFKLCAMLAMAFATLVFANSTQLIGQQVDAAATADKKSESKDSEAPEAKKQPTDENDQTPPAKSDGIDEILRGHSYHGEAFNEGPRQDAYLMGGTGNVSFPVSTESKEAQAFINQGVGQLHGFWDLEAERSFRKAATLDPDCAMAYWGAAWAAGANKKRAKGFIKKAVTLKKNATKREQQYIEALNKYLADKPKEKKKRAAQYLKDLESIVIDYPDDLEAKALVAHRVWHNARDGIPVSSYLSTDALLKQIYDVEPLHPAHHYSIHLWDHRHPKNALQAAARCGVAAPSIAHMWHMPGHIYSRLKRYEDAIYQQEASARVDHAHMMRDHVMPDSISNFPHNNEWLIRNLVFVGRADDAVELAKNMIELPRHPKNNTLEKKTGSASYGRRRLLQVLREFQLWDESIELCQSVYLDTADLPDLERAKTLRLLGCASTMKGDSTLAESAEEQLNAMLVKKEKHQWKLKTRIGKLEVAIDQADDQPPAPKKIKVDDKKAKLQIEEKKKKLRLLKSEVAQIKICLKAIKGYQAIAEERFDDAQKLLKKTAEDESLIAELEFKAGKADEAIKKLKKIVDEKRINEVVPLARLVHLYHQNGDVDLAKESITKLREASGCFKFELPLFKRLQPIVDQMEWEVAENSDWRKPYSPPADLGFRPDLNSLGPFRWSPPTAGDWDLMDAENKTISSSEFAGKPHLIIFYLGHGCLHCAEQLQEFAPRANDFKAAGIDVIAISTDDQSGLQTSLAEFEGEMPIRLAANESLSVFKTFRAFDDFENLPLHGTFLIDGKGRIRWQDISHQPFMDDEFLLQEAKRLLAEPPTIRVATESH